ncbi:response regulator [Roseateles sp.]|uniref:response regulator n=1 Tax=Roseateles sp. TaxID=1971397 RepID=UPI003BACF513
MTGRVVLIADDNPDAADTLGMVLEMSGHTVLVAYGGRQALETAQRERPGVVVLDIGMPEMDGYQVAERIRAEPWGADVLLIALTGWDPETGRRNSHTVGFDHHLVKPVDPAVLERLLA